AGGAPLHLLAVHLTAGGAADKAARRREQWTRAHAIAAALRAGGARRVAIVGDTNSTGYLDNAHAERDFVEARARENAMEVATRLLGCSEYWPPRDGVLEPSLLDHVVATPALARAGSVRVYGYCAALACAPPAAG